MHESLVGWAALVIGHVALHLACLAQSTAADVRLQADHWSDRCPDADRVLLDTAAITAANRRMLEADRSVRDLDALPATILRPAVVEHIETLAGLPDVALVGDDSAAVIASDRKRWLAACRLDAIAESIQPRFAVVTRRAALRRLPTAERIHRVGGPTDIDLLQESAFFPGTPVAAVHATAENRWTFVLGTTSAAWIETTALAFAARDTVFAYAGRSGLIVTAAYATAVPLEAGAEFSELTLDMGTALPALENIAPVGGPVVELPVRAADGGLRLVPARIAPVDAVHNRPLPASRRHVLQQAFRFLGEPYGWGHDHGARDCSGFICEVYRSLGILLPRNTHDQAASPALDRSFIEPEWPSERRLAAIARLLPGDLVYTPGHVMMVVGHDEAGSWVIHDTHTGRLTGEEATARGVVVAPLERMLTQDGGSVVDAVTTLVRILPTAKGERP